MKSFRQTFSFFYLTATIEPLESVNTITANVTTGAKKYYLNVTYFEVEILWVKQCCQQPGMLCGQFKNMRMI